MTDGEAAGLDAAELEELRETIAYRAVLDCLYRYARGIDRRDRATFESAFWPGAHVDYSFWKGEIGAFIDLILPGLTGAVTQHFFGNCIARFDGDDANAETYFQAYHRLEIDGAMRDVFVAGRYLDRFERRGREWRIQDRVLVFDWYRQMPDSGDWSIGFFGITDVTGVMGRTDETDASHGHGFGKMLAARRGVHTG